jgi:hypothetical protein
MATKKTSRSTNKTAGTPKCQTAGEGAIDGLKEAIAWTRGENSNVRVTVMQVPAVDVRKVRAKMGFS